MEGGETMDFFELAKVIFTRVQKLEPENVYKIMGCIFLKHHGMQEMVQLAFGPDAALLSKAIEADIMLAVLSSSKSSMPDTSSRTNLCGAQPYWDAQYAPEQRAPSQNVDFVPRAYADSSAGEFSLHNQSQGVEQMDPPNHIGKYFLQESAVGGVGGGMASSRSNRRSHSLSDLPPKACHYYNKGYCKHGLNCRYSHSQSFPDGYPRASSANITDYVHEEHDLTPKSLDKLEREIAELLRCKRGMPVSIASLPMLYFEKYGRNLQAEGYLSESQRHGKAGLNLTKLLSHFRKSIRLIERPHGQHSVILAEDALRYTESRNERSDLVSPVSSSHQIYLTFPAESTFTEEDVSKYFKQYGQVRDVRIPCQERRMYGFVSFVHPETAHMVLTMGNPHYICGARVLVKEYKEKSKVKDRAYSDKVKSVAHYSSQHVAMDQDIHSGHRDSDNSRQLRNHLPGEKDLLMGFERLGLNALNLPTKPAPQQRYLTQGMEDLKVSEGSNEFFLGPFSFSYAFNASSIGSAGDEIAKQTTNSSGSDQESGHIELPESPFASPRVGSSIPAVM